MPTKYFARRLRWGSCVLALAVIANRQCPAAQPLWQEAELISLLTSDAPNADKALACKRLAVCGSAAATPALGKLLDSPQLSSWARIALEAIPDAAAEQQLITALDRTTGDDLIGVINSLAVRRSSSACKRLTELASSPEPSVVGAAIRALGTIGEPNSSHVLLSALADQRPEIREAAGEATIHLAEHIASKAEPREVLLLCESVRTAPISPVWQAAAARLELVADPDHRVERLVGLLQAKEPMLFEIALTSAREFDDRAVTDALLQLLPELAPVRQAQVLHVLRDRADKSALPAALQHIKAKNPNVQVAALGVVAVLGDASCLETLLTLSKSSDQPTVRSAAWDALKSLPGPAVDRALVELAESAQGEQLRTLLELVGERHISALPLLQAATRSADQSIRHTAWLALGRTVTPSDLQLMIESILAPPNVEDLPTIAAALRKAAVRMPDSTIAVRELANALPLASPDTKTHLIQIVADVEGAEALSVVSAAARDDDAALKESASASLGRWRSAEAAPMLLEIAKSESAGKYQVRAIRGYLRIARQFDMPAQERVEMCEQALQVASRKEERAIVLDVLRAHPSLELLELIDNSEEREHLRHATPEIIGVLLQYYPHLQAELHTKLKDFGFEPSALPGA